MGKGMKTIQTPSLSPILVSGGLQRPDAATQASTSGTHYHRARLTEVDLESGPERVLLDYETPPEACARETPGIRFTCMTRTKDRLYLPTGTELLVLSMPDLERIAYATHPHFHDVHHAAPMNGGIAVASTGLELVIHLDPETMEPVRYQNVTSEEIWSRFDPGRDWRKVHTTQPHEAHPNFLITAHDLSWVTRAYKNDVMCLENPERRLHLSDYRVHDGIMHRGKAWFTSVNGALIRADLEAGRVEETITLADMEETTLPLGWCRGLALDWPVAYVGFTTLRTTRWKDNVEVFLNNSTGEYIQVMPSRVTAYDLEARRKLTEYVFPRESMGAVFGIVLGDNREPDG